MADSLVVGLSSWIIQDGNYGDFSRGERAAFALEFYASTEIRRSKPITQMRTTKRACHLGHSADAVATPLDRCRRH